MRVESICMSLARRYRQLIVVMLATSAIGLLVQPAGGASFVRARKYIGNHEGPAACMPEYSSDTVDGIGGVCFWSPPPGSVSIELVDDAGRSDIGGWYELQDLSGRRISSGFFCDSATVQMPSGTALLFVRPSGWYSTFFCQSRSGYSVSGWAVAEFQPAV